MFNKPTVDLNVNQLRLLEWLDFYKILLELEQHPPDDMLNYDYLIDGWLENYVSKQKRANKYSKLGKAKKQYSNTMQF